MALMINQWRKFHSIVLYPSMSAVSYESRQCMLLRQNHRVFGGKCWVCIVQPSSTSPDLEFVSEEAELRLPLWEIPVLFHVGLSIHDPDPFSLQGVIQCEFCSCHPFLQQFHELKDICSRSEELVVCVKRSMSMS